jgi:hypothetical protein
MESGGEPLRSRLPAAVQTNEVGRSCALLPGFLAVAQRAPLPLRRLEIGARAGLNLRWDAYAYETDAGLFGNVQSLVVFRDRFLKRPEWPSEPVRIIERKGCDLSPVALDHDGCLTLLSFVWPDQPERFNLLAYAIREAARIPVQLDGADAAGWLKQELAEPNPGASTVLFHSLVRSYLTPESRATIERLILEAGERASVDAPLAWLRMEPGGEQAEVRLTYWPPGETGLVAKSTFHGSEVA